MFCKKMDLPSVLQRQIAMYTPEAGLKLRRGDRFLGNREITHQIRNCICGLCVSTGAQTQTSSTLFDTDDGRVVRRQQTELCRSFCLARNCVSMLQKLIRGLLKKIASRSGVAGDIRLTLKRDGPGQPYIFEVQYFDRELLGSFFIGVDGLGEEEHFRIPYALGADIDFAKILPRPEFKLLKTALERTLIAEDGQAFSLVVIAQSCRIRISRWQAFIFATKLLVCFVHVLFIYFCKLRHNDLSNTQPYLVQAWTFQFCLHLSTLVMSKAASHAANLLQLPSYAM